MIVPSRAAVAYSKDQILISTLVHVLALRSNNNKISDRS